MHGARATLRDAAPELCAGQSEVIAQHPEQRRLRRGGNLAVYAVDVYHCHEFSPCVSVSLRLEVIASSGISFVWSDVALLGGRDEEPL
jgi:hypothetical protein